MIIEHVVQHPSLEFNWLPNSIKKELILPQIYFVSNSKAGGGYYNVHDLDNAWGNLKKRPIITIDIINADRIPSTIAHEYRHHWQMYTYGDWKPASWSVPKNSTYKKSIIKFFNSCPYERDALNFEIKMSPNDVNLQWKEWLMK